MYRAIVFLSLYAFSFASHAAAPVCTATYCYYTGQVNQAYVNEYNQVILYYDTMLTPAQSTAMNTTHPDGCVVDLSTAAGAQFGEMFYATLLSAQATRRAVTVFIFPAASTGLFPRCDRIWLAQ
jgi:hypothetical protein